MYYFLTFSDMVLNVVLNLLLNSISCAIIGLSSSLPDDGMILSHMRVLM